MIYMQARFYMPWYGRFTSTDPARDQHFEDTQSWNIYSYVRNNPIMATDPTGMVESSFGEPVKTNDPPPNPGDKVTNVQETRSATDPNGDLTYANTVAAQTTTSDVQLLYKPLTSADTSGRKNDATGPYASEADMQKLGEATSTAVVISHVGVNTQVNADGTKTPVFGLLAAPEGAPGQPLTMVSLPAQVKAQVAIIGVCFGDFATSSSGTKFQGAYAIGTNSIDTKFALMAWDQVKGMSGSPGQIVTAFKQAYDSLNARRLASPGDKTFSPLDGTFRIGGF